MAASLISVTWITRGRFAVLHNRGRSTEEWTMWSERQWRDRRIGIREILGIWAIVALIVLALVAWAGVQALIAVSETPVADRGDS